MPRNQTSQAWRKNASLVAFFSTLGLLVACSSGEPGSAATDLLPPDRVGATSVVFEPGQEFVLDVDNLPELASFGQIRFTRLESEPAPVFRLDGQDSRHFRIDSLANLYAESSLTVALLPAMFEVRAFASSTSTQEIGNTTVTVRAGTVPMIVIYPRQAFVLRTGRASASESLSGSFGRLAFRRADGMTQGIFSLSGVGADLFRIDMNANLFLIMDLPGNRERFVLTVNAHTQSISSPIVARNEIVIEVAIDEMASTLDFTAVPISEADSSHRRTIRFTPVLGNLPTPTSWRWDFGDGSPPSSSLTPAHTYSRAGSYTVEMTATDDNGQSISVSHRVYPYDEDDPLRPLQWYHDNDPISTFLGGVPNDRSRFIFTTPRGRALALEGEDIGAIDHLQACGVRDTCRGEGIVVQVVDVAAQLDHPDLAANTSLDMSANLFDDPVDAVSAFSQYQQLSPAPPENRRRDIVAENRRQSHGTAVSGIILARDLNGVGLAGIAPRAELASYNYLDNQTSQNRIRTIMAPGVDVSNNSWSTVTQPGSEGFFEYQLGSSTTILEATEEIMAEARNGLGKLIFKAAGNDGAAIGPLEAQFGNHQNASAESTSNFRYVMTIGSIGPDGRMVSASEGGANVLLVAYENRVCGLAGPLLNFGIFQGILQANPVGVVTTDPVGPFGTVWMEGPPLFGGRLASPRVFQPPDDILDYNYCFTGTSASTPMVSAAAALLLQARPDLSWRDVRAVLVHSARQNDPSIGQNDPRIEQWSLNGVNMPVHHLYGFGTLDIESALELARNWRNFSDEISFDSGLMNINTAIPDCSNSCGLAPPTPENGTSFTASLTPATSIKQIETVQVEVDMEFAARNGVLGSSRALRGTVAIALDHIGADGSVLSSSVLHKFHPYYRGIITDSDLRSDEQNPSTSGLNWTFLSLRHFGESPSGTWRLRITDYIDDDSTITLNSWRLIMHGH